MKIIRSPIAASHRAARAVGRVVLVPSMGALHDGHLALVRRAKRLAGNSGEVWVSLFVNPTQFGPKEDLARYPRTFRRDARLCREAGVDVLFAPQAGAMYAPDHSVFVEESELAQVLCGRSRPGHFRGVCTVVAKLFLIARPTVAVFGRKDFQQLAILRRMVRDLNFPVRIEAVPTVRESDGLALSSRNALLGPQERAQAPALYAALCAAAQLPRGTPSATLRAKVRRSLARAPLARVDYIELVDAGTLRPARVVAKGSLLAAAVFFGKTRLIEHVHFP